MAHASIELIEAIRRTAKKLSDQQTPYQWGHMGSCNCGNLAQELTKLTKAEIHQFAMQGRGDWREQVEEFCPTSGLPMDLLIADMLNYGLTTSDLQNLERLSDKGVLARIDLNRRNQLRHNFRDDVILYLQEWANMLEEEFTETITFDLSFLEEKSEEKKEAYQLV